MRVIDHEQGSEAWLRSRLGCPSGSNFGKLITATGKPSAQAESYINQLIAEALTETPTHMKVTEWMQRGTDLEPVAREFYELASGHTVDQVGFCKADEIECGVSPDGLINSDGALEIKVPAPCTHIEWLRAGNVPAKHIPQCQGVLYVTGRKWIDFVSYNEKMPVLIVHLKRDEDYIAALEIEVIKAVNTIEKEVNRLRKM